MSHQDPAPAPGSNREDSLFAAARQRPSSERAAFLEGACVGDPALRERLELRLLIADQTEQGLATRVEGIQETLHLDIADFPSDESVGESLGRYKLLEKLGEGGCGVVYVAEQTEPVRRRVALKVIKLGMDTKAVVARFEAERQALAMMDHPNIARVLDAGTTERGRPYFVMELVRGVRITDFCDQGNLSTRDRLELFIKVCQAIQHAHQKGIIHRDIKPSNILVTLHDGVPVPKVIDFGIAKATEGRLTEATVYTQLNQFIGTPAYMSPEQAEMSGLDIDTRSDIYSLGVLLYELLTGRTPFDFQSLMSQGLDAMRKAIREEEPARPSTRLATLKGEELTTAAKRRSVEAPRLANLLRGDLDWIVMKSLEKDRTRRYDTANGLAMDLGRHLANEPVLARPPSLGYRFQKAVRRNRLAFMAGSAVAAALVAGLVLSATQTVRARQAEKLAASRLVESEKLRADSEAARQEAEAIANFMSDVFYNPDPTRDAKKLTVAESLARAAASLQGQLSDQPARRASLQRTLSRSYSGLGLHIDAAVLQDQVLRFYQAHYGPEHTNTLDIGSALAHSMGSSGHHDKAAEIREELVRLRRRLQGNDNPNTLVEMLNLAEDLHATGDPDRALKLREEALNSCRRNQGPNSEVTARALAGVAQSYVPAGRGAEAVSLMEEALKAHRSLFGPYDPRTIASIQTLSELYAKSGRLPEAIRLQEEALQTTESELGEDSPVSIMTKVRLGLMRLESGNRDEALRLHQAMLPAMRKVIYPSPALDEGWVTFLEKWADFSRTLRGLENVETLEAVQALGDAYIKLGQMEKAVAKYRELVAIRRRIQAPDAPELIDSLRRLAGGLGFLKEPKAVTEVLTEVADILRKSRGNSSTETLSAIQMLAGAAAESDSGYRVLSLLEEAWDVSSRALGPEHPDTLDCILKVSETKYQLGKATESLAIVRKYMPVFQRVLGPDHATTGALFGHYGHVLDALGRPDEAIQAWKDAVALNPRWVNIQYWLGKALVDQHRYAEALPVLRLTLERMKSGAQGREVAERLRLAESMAGGKNRKSLAYVTPVSGTPLAEMLSGMKEWVNEHPEDSERSKHLALLQLWLGKSDQHREICRRMLEVAAKSTDPTAHDRAAKAYLLQGRPDPEILKLAVASARSAVDLAGPRDPNLRWFQLVLGLSAYRSGNDEMAEKYLGTAIDGASDLNMLQLAVSIRAMARWRSGHVEEARQDLAEAARSMVDPPDRLLVGATTRNPDKLAIYLAFEEARALMNSPVASQK